MPGCGKSVTGRTLAQRLGKEFLDLDKLVEEKARMPIPRIFAQEGEEAFRRLETQTIMEAGARTGCVISTGGGAVTRQENYAPLRQNGVIVHLTRDLKKLPKAGRPVSQSTELSELWRRREPMYRAFADVTVSNDGLLDETIHQIEKELTTL
jgi:shikimate kinase